MSTQTAQSGLLPLVQEGMDRLRTDDAELYDLLEREVIRQTGVLAMVAASSIADPSVLVCEGTATTNVTTEGYPGARFHAGCGVVDEIERLAIARARAAFRAQYANVQPHSGSSANCIVMFSVLEPGDTILGLELEAGGHLTHGAKASVSGRYFNAVGYGLDESDRIDYDQVHRLAVEYEPKLIICGASAYPRTIDFKRFREIADGVGALLLADISHIAGLVVTGEHPSPIDHAHFTTTSTYKQLCGPRGGLILIGRDHDMPGPDGTRTLASTIQRAVFPFFQGTPNLSAIAAKARALAQVTSASFKELGRRIVEDAQALVEGLANRDFDIVTGGTDNHIVLVNVLSSRNMTGIVAERALEECGVIINKNKIPGDQKSAVVTSGLRLGTTSLASRGMAPEHMEGCADLISRILASVSVTDDRTYRLDPDRRDAFRAEVTALCDRFPISGYPRGSG